VPANGAVTAPAMPAVHDLDWDTEDEITDVNQGARDSETSPAPVARKATLVVLRGLEAGRMFTLDREATLIGRDASSHVRYEDKGLSRRHARIVHTGGRYFIEDLGSRNGTFVDGERVQRMELRGGERIALSATVVFRFSLVDEIEERIGKQLFEASTRDALTGVFNRRYLDERLAAEVSFAHRHGGELGVAMFDIDHFKKVNDGHGHLAGDAVLRAVARRVGSLIRAEDVLARYGGEEFVILARGVPREGVVRLAERVRRAVEELPIDVGGQTLSLTVSVGVATLAECDAHATGDLLVAHVDERLYRAKATGRNRVCGE
jgi:two-component system cell cycle response regulator